VVWLLANEVIGADDERVASGDSIELDFKRDEDLVWLPKTEKRIKLDSEGDNDCVWLTKTDELMALDSDANRDLVWL
jgi:hypothetical protein